MLGLCVKFLLLEWHQDKQPKYRNINICVMRKRQQDDERDKFLNLRHFFKKIKKDENSNFSSCSELKIVILALGSSDSNTNEFNARDFFHVEIIYNHGKLIVERKLSTIMGN